MIGDDDDDNEDEEGVSPIPRCEGPLETGTLWMPVPSRPSVPVYPAELPRLMFPLYRFPRPSPSPLESPVMRPPEKRDVSRLAESPADEAVEGVGVGVLVTE